MARRAAIGSVALGLSLALPVRAEPPARAEGFLLAIRSDSTCPDAAAVDHKTRELLGLGADVTLAEVVELVREGSGLSVKLRSDDQRVLGERVLPLDDECDALARATAVVLASWLTDAHPEFLAAAPAPEPAPPAPPPPAPVPPPVRVVPHVAAHGELRVDTALRAHPFAGVGLLAGAGGVVPAATVGVSLAPSGSGLGLTARVGLATQRKLPLGSGELRLQRWPLGAGAVVRLERGAVAGELHAGAALAWLHLEGRGFSPDRTVNDVAFGAYGAVRGSWVLGFVEPFVEVAAFGWPGAGSAFVDPPDPGVDLPRGELVPVVGLVLRP